MQDLKGFFIGDKGSCNRLVVSFQDTINLFIGRGNDVLAYGCFTMTTIGLFLDFIDKTVKTENSWKFMKMMECENLRGDQQTVAFITETSQDRQNLFDVKRVNDLHIHTDESKMTHTVFIGETTGLTLPTIL
jgi:hypothetical protein